MAGSSPRVRGTPAARRRAAVVARFIPAGAGNAPADRSLDRSAAVHPRGCGERLPELEPEPDLSGSSPRVRGTRQRARPSGEIRRFIPAGAGNARRRWPAPVSTPVHPRGCGERATATPGTITTCGSSPRVRGTPKEICIEPGKSRFIPAGAGNALCRRANRGSRAVHPRGCGERSAVQKTDEMLHGSSPRVRGTHVAAHNRGYVRRFIPAGAGNAGLRVHRPCHSPVHPRGCGERASPTDRASQTRGSSPRVRGTRG